MGLANAKNSVLAPRIAVRAAAMASAMQARNASAPIALRHAVMGLAIATKTLVPVKAIVQVPAAGTT